MKHEFGAEHRLRPSLPGVDRRTEVRCRCCNAPMKDVGPVGSTSRKYKCSPCKATRITQVGHNYRRVNREYGAGKKVIPWV